MNLALSHPHRIAGLVVLDTSPVAYDSSNNPAWKAVEHIVSVVREVKLEPGKTKRDIDVDLRQSLEDPALRAFVLTNLESVGGDSGTKGDRGGTLLRWKINIEVCICVFMTTYMFEIPFCLATRVGVQVV